MSPLVGCPGPVFFVGGTRTRTKTKTETKTKNVRGCLLSGGLMPVPPKFNACTHRLGFLCLAS